MKTMSDLVVFDIFVGLRGGKVFSNTAVSTVEDTIEEYGSVESAVANFESFIAAEWTKTSTVTLLDTNEGYGAFSARTEDVMWVAGKIDLNVKDEDATD